MVEVMFVPASTGGKSGMRGWLADEKFSAVAKYVQRACYLLSQGTPAAKIAVYFPTTSIWLGNNEAEESTLPSCKNYWPCNDFDVVDEQSLQSLNETRKREVYQLERSDLFNGDNSTD